ncbi:hypothetical protein RSAG8_03226, partial [Rhizoctonia solani AG-8 WAC10335]
MAGYLGFGGPTIDRIDHLNRQWLYCQVRSSSPDVHSGRSECQIL